MSRYALRTTDTKKRPLSPGVDSGLVSAVQVDAPGKKARITSPILDTPSLPVARSSSPVIMNSSQTACSESSDTLPDDVDPPSTKLDNASQGDAGSPPVDAPATAPTEDVSLETGGGTDMLTTETRDYFSAATVARLNRMLTFTNIPNEIYAVRMVPFASLQWGPSTQGRPGWGVYLWHGGRQVTVWIIGELMSLKVTNNRVVAGVVPFHEVDRNAAIRLLHEHRAPPQTEPYLSPAIWARAWEVPYGQSATATNRWDHYYDATKKWAGKEASAASKIPMSEISPSDVVMLQVALKRRYVQDPVPNTTETKTNFSQWYIDFELECVALLRRTPKTVPTPPVVTAYEI